MDVLKRLDAEVDTFMIDVRFFHEPLTVERAKTFVRQHRLNTRYRNSVLKLSVAAICPDWDLRMKIINTCSEELIADVWRTSIDGIAAAADAIERSSSRAQSRDRHQP